MDTVHSIYGERQISQIFQEFESFKDQNTADWAVYFYNNHARFLEQIGDFAGQDIVDCLRKFKTLQEIFDAFRYIEYFRIHRIFFFLLI